MSSSLQSAPCRVGFPPESPLPVQMPVQIAQLAKAVRAIETQTFERSSTAISTGCPAIDAELPGGGLHAGTIVEWVSDWAGDGAMVLALLAAKSAMGEQQHAILIDAQNEFYPPAAAALGIDLSRLIILRPTNRTDAMWSFDQSLRCPAIAAVIASQDRIDDINSRRLQLAAEQGSTLGLLLRNASKMQGPTTWSEMTWKVSSLSSPPSANQGLDGLGEYQNRPPNTPSYSDNFRWLHVQLTRMRAGRGKSNFASHIAAGNAGFEIALEAHRGPIYARRAAAQTTQPREDQRYGSTSTVHLASQLAMPARRRPASSRPAAAG